MLISIQNFLNSGSKNMNVDGSSVSKVFTYSPGSGSACITGLTCLLKDDGTSSFDKFGAISGLSNGILITTTISNNTRTITTIKDNADLCTRFHYNQFGNSAVLSILSVATPEGFGNTNNVFVGYLDFPSPVILKDSDSIDITIRDNLTNIDFLQISCKIIQD